MGKIFDSSGNETSDYVIENHRHIFSRPFCSSCSWNNAEYRHYTEAQRWSKMSVYARLLTQVAGFSTLLDRLRIPPCVAVILYGSFVIVMNFHNPVAVIALVYTTCKSERTQITEGQVREVWSEGSPSCRR